MKDALIILLLCLALSVCLYIAGLMQQSNAPIPIKPSRLPLTNPDFGPFEINYDDLSSYGDFIGGAQW